MMQRPIRRPKRSAPGAAAGRRPRFAEPLEPRRMLEALPVINELMAQNTVTLQSSFGTFDDWIEIYNPGPGAVDLQNWYLTDTKNELHLWQFPAVTLPESGYLLVFASGRDEVTPAGEMHTNFKLGVSGEYLALVKPDGTTVVSEYEPTYPPQTPDVSFGLTTALDETTFFNTPTPGAMNTPYFKAGVFTHPHGFYEAPLRVSVDPTLLPGPIHYTVDGSVPTLADPLFAGSLLVDRTTTLRVKAFGPGASSSVYTQTYIFPEGVLQQTAAPAGLPAAWQNVAGTSTPADYAMDSQVVDDPAYAAAMTESLLALPSVSLTLDPDDLYSRGSGIYANPLERGDPWERAVSVELIEPDSAGFQVDAGMRIEGGSSRDPLNSPKHSLRLRFSSAYGPSKLEYPLLPEAGLERFDGLILSAGSNDSWLDPDGALRASALLARDQWVRQTQQAMGQPSASGRLVHLYLNGLYWGVYDLTERIDNEFAENHFGGRKRDYDIIDTGELDDGQIDGWNAMMALATAGVSTNQKYQAIRQYLDIDNFIDFTIVNMLAGKADLADGDWFAVRNRAIGEPFRFFAWDSERALGDVHLDLSNTAGPGAPAFLYSQLRQNAEFRLAFADRIQRHLMSGGVLTPEANGARWNELADELGSAIVAESARWGDYRRDVHSYSSGPYELYTRNDQWLPESQRLLNVFFPQRSAIVFDQFRAAGLYSTVVAPSPNRSSGQVAPGDAIALSAPTGSIYYTNDGTDPRSFGGPLGPSALPYTTPIPITTDTVLKARSLSGEQWSPLVEMHFYLPLPLAISEIQYHALTGGQYGDDQFDFIELLNTGSQPVDLTHVSLAGAARFDFGAGSVATLSPGQRIVVIDDSAAFASRYGNGPLVAGEYSGRLGNTAGIVRLVGSLGQVVAEAAFDESWYPITDDEGFSLVARNSASNAVSALTADYWRPSHMVGGSPGLADSGYNPGDVVISEGLTHNDGTYGDWLELHNATDRSVDISGWYMSDTHVTPKEYQIPAGTVLPPDGYAVFAKDTSNPPPGLVFAGALPFSLDKLGDTIRLISAGPNGELGGYRETTVFGYGYNSVTFIRYTNSTGQTEYVEGAYDTMGGPNSAPLIFPLTHHHAFVSYPVLLNEIMYYPPPGGDEYIELFNPSSQPADLDEPYGSWRMIGGVVYNFPADVVVPPGGYALLVPIDPNQFRAKYAVPPETQIFGPYTGELLNSGELLAIGRAAEGGAYLPYTAADKVFYNHPSGNWPAEAAGQGASLNRRSSFDYGNDVINWTASAPGGTPGRPNVDARTTGIAGVTYHDLNANGRRDAGEPAVGGFTLFLDRNGNGNLDPLEHSTVSAADGSFSFTNIALGQYTVAQVPRPGWTQTGPAGPGSHVATTVDGTLVGGVEIGSRQPGPAVVEQYVFYNNSAFDGGNPAPGAADDAAIANDKRPLLPGQTATFANYTNFSKGINGVMIDAVDLPGTITLASFQFRVGNSSTPGSWNVLSTQPTLSIRPGAGLSGSNRITLVWPDGAIKKQWLQVTLLATAATGVARPYVFYFGNAIGETGNESLNTQVNAGDELQIRAHPRNLVSLAPIDFIYDINRDRQVNAADQLSARGNTTNLATALRLIAPPTSAGPPAPAALGEAALGQGNLLDVIDTIARRRRLAR